VVKEISAWADAHLEALTFGDLRLAVPVWLNVATAVVHLLGLAATAYLMGAGVWLAPLGLGLLLVPVYYRARGILALPTLAPLFFLYAIIAARFVYIRVLGGNVPGYFDYNAPDLCATFFRLEPWLVCVLIYTLAIQIRLLAHQAWSRILASVLIGLTFTWASLLYIGQRTNGVTGTDPYAYAQMGIDLATRGTPLHRFTLFPSVASLGVTWSPIVHTGYHIPINANGDAPSVWPIGGSFAMAFAYRIAGEAGLYLVNPIASLLLLVATGWLTWELFADSKYRAWIVALSIAILATAHALFDWATVPMVDAQAALFSILAILFALLARRNHTILFPILAGGALGAAYFVRHTQVLLAPAMMVLLWWNDAPRRARVRAVMLAGLAALFVALPDLWYHHIVFGNWLTPESTELNLFSIASVGDTIAGLNVNLFAAREFGWLVPFIVYGTYRLARDKRVEFVALAIWVLVLLGFHLLYPALRPRDLLPEFPPLVVVIAYGIVALIAWLWRSDQGWHKIFAATGLMATLFLLLIRVWNVLPIPLGEPQRSFGYLTAEQRAAFERIAALTPPRAVIGSTLNSGAIELYAHRETFLPTMWSMHEQDRFFEAMWSEGRAVYLLEDGAGMTNVRRALETRYTLHRVDVLDVSLFSGVDGTAGMLWEIMRTKAR
jgi:hypothetical protein